MLAGATMNAGGQADRRVATRRPPSREGQRPWPLLHGSAGEWVVASFCAVSVALLFIPLYEELSPWIGITLVVMILKSSSRKLRATSRTSSSFCHTDSNTVPSVGSFCLAADCAL